MRSWLKIVQDRPGARLATRADERRGARRRPVLGRVMLVLAVLAAALALTTGGSARAADGGADPLAGLLARNAPVICRDQTYALCAGARCFVFNDVAYCGCDVRKGNSVSSPFNFDGGYVCSVNAAGVNNGYMVSTFSLPKQLVAPSGDQALYVCPRTSRAAYAKCDGGICFTSTINDVPPGPDTPPGGKRIVCSCPVEKANFLQGLEIIGPYPCQQKFFRNCDAAFATSDTGSILYDGTSIGSTEIGVRVLDGNVPPLNVCR